MPLGLLWLKTELSLSVSEWAPVSRQGFCSGHVAPACCVGEMLPVPAIPPPAAQPKISSRLLRTDLPTPLLGSGASSGLPAGTRRLGNFFHSSQKEKQFEAFLSFLTLLCQRRYLVLKGKKISPWLLNLLLK